MWENKITKEEALKFDKDLLTILLQETQLYAEKVSENINRLTNKATIFLGIVIGIGGFTYSRISDNINDIKSHPLLLVMIVIYACSLFYAFLLLLREFLWPQKFYPVGSPPQDTMTTNIMNLEYNKGIYGLMVNYHITINDNLKKIENMKVVFARCVRCVFLVPIILTILYVLIYYVLTLGQNLHQVC